MAESCSCSKGEGHGYEAAPCASYRAFESEVVIDQLDEPSLSEAEVNLPPSNYPLLYQH